MVRTPEQSGAEKFYIQKKYPGELKTTFTRTYLFEESSPPSGNVSRYAHACQVLDS